jgi:hypothetical protein
MNFKKIKDDYIGKFAGISEKVQSGVSFFTFHWQTICPNFSFSTLNKLTGTPH